MTNKTPPDPNPSGIVFLQPVSEHKLRQARELRKEMTPEERMVWERVRRNQILGLQIRRQQPIEGFVADFYCNQARCVIEIDGSVHDDSERKKEDAHRRRVFEARGLSEIRFRNEEVRNDIEDVVRRLTEYLRARL